MRYALTLCQLNLIVIRAGTHDFFADIIINYTGYKPSGGSNVAAQRPGEQIWKRRRSS